MASAAGANGRPDPGERFGRFYEELRKPARTMVRRAFRGAFCDDEIEDIYGSAWLGTLRALDRRGAELSDAELRRYVLTAVANQASKELRRRRRRGTAPLEHAERVADPFAASPEERAAGRERSQVARDVLASLPERRRAVLVLRYGWELEPEEIRRLVRGLSPRAYRREIQRGVEEVARKLELTETGEWCAEREPVLAAFAAGEADSGERRQAEEHLAHCRPCAELVGRLSGHLHDLGSAAAWPAVVGSIGERSLGLGERALGVWERVHDAVGGLADRGRDALGGLASRGGEAASRTGEHGADAATAVAASGGARGAGAAGAGALAKLAGVGAAGKATIACLAGGTAASVCVAAGVVPGVELGGGPGRGERSDGKPAKAREAVSATERSDVPDLPPPRTAPPERAEPAKGKPPAPPQGRGGGDGGGSEQVEAEVDPDPEPTYNAPPRSPAPAAPATQQEFGLPGAAAGTASGTSGDGGSSNGSTAESGGGSSGGGSSGGGGGGSGGGSAVQREFGP